MFEREQHHRRPPLAGVVREFEGDERIKKLCEGRTATQAVRFRQAVGVVVRLVLTKHEWLPASKRGSLTGLSKWFERTERYMSWNDV